MAAGVVTDQWSYNVLHSGEQLVFDLGLLTDDVAYPFNLHLPHDEFSAIVLRHLERYPQATVLWNTPVLDIVQDRQGVSVSSCSPDGLHVIRAAWAIGADGAHSAVRRSLGLGFAGMTWPERLVSLSVAYDFSEIGYLSTTYQLDPLHGALIGRVDREGLWRYVFAESRLLPERTVAERIPEAWRKAFPDFEVQPLAWSAYRIHERAATRLRIGRVLLAGDAGHLTNPTGSYGLAGGLFDSIAASNALIAVLQGGNADSLLDGYATDRERYFRMVASPLSSETMHLVFHAEDIESLNEDVEHYRQIVNSPERHREFLLLSRELEDLPAA
jgi:3-(3-hydroxy-phenyl)propionate hydroxylase/6-hydroxy-3-succinoylpyridine 3-monooxygenase